MAQTVQKKQQKRKKTAAVEHPDSTPPAPKRVKVSQAQTARKSTGGREPPPRRAGGGGGGGGGGGDDSGDDGDGDGGAPRAGPSRQRMWCSSLQTRLRGSRLSGCIDALNALHELLFVGAPPYPPRRPKFRVGSKRARAQKAAVQTGHRRPSRDSEVSEEHGPAPAEASLCAHRTCRLFYFFLILRRAL